MALLHSEVEAILVEVTFRYSLDKVKRTEQPTPAVPVVKTCAIRSGIGCLILPRSFHTCLLATRSYSSP